MKVLKTVFRDGPLYIVDSLIVEGDRAAAEVQGSGTLINGQEYHNTYAFIFRVRDGRIASIVEHTNPLIVSEKILPLVSQRA